MSRKLAWALLLLSGCSFESAGTIASVDNRCGSDADCAQGICDAQLCIDDTGASVSVAIEVIDTAPDANLSVPASWAYESESFSGSSVHDLRLPVTRDVLGTVRWDGIAVPAALRFTRRMPGSVAPFEPLPVDVDTLREPIMDEDGVYDYSTRLVAGETYDVVVLPTADMVASPSDDYAPAIRSLPPLYLDVTVEAGESNAPFRFDVAYPGYFTRECTAALEAGCTLAASVFSFDGASEEAEADLQVRAVEKATGRVVSSIGETNAFGYFTIRVSEEASDYVIRVTSSVGNEPFPAVSVDPDVAFAGDPDEKVIQIPRVEPIQFTGRVRDEEGSPVPGAVVRFTTETVFEGSELGLQGSFSNSATTNGDGSFGAQLMPGFYSIIVTPPDDASSTWGVLKSEALVGEELSVAEALVVPSKVELSGSVRTFRDEAAVGVPVVGQARQGLGEGRRPIAPKSPFRTHWADSRCKWTSAPTTCWSSHPSESGFPWWVEPALLMDGNLDSSRTSCLPPIPIEGVVEGERRSAGSQCALIRAYVLTGDGASQRGRFKLARRRPTTRGTTGLLIAPRSRRTNEHPRDRQERKPARPIAKRQCRRVSCVRASALPCGGSPVSAGRSAPPRDRVDRPPR